MSEAERRPETAEPVPGEAGTVPEAGNAPEQWALLLRQRDEARQEAEALRSELQNYRRADYLMERGVDPREAGYLAWQLGSRLTAEQSFEDAAEQYLGARTPRPVPLRVDLTAPIGGGMDAASPGETMNRLLRDAGRRGR